MLFKLEIRSIERQVTKGPEKGKKFMAFQVFNKKTGYYEELRFNKLVITAPKIEGKFIIDVEQENINRQDQSRRKFPLTWVSKIESIVEDVTQNGKDQAKELPF